MPVSERICSMVAHVAGQWDAVDDDFAGLVLFKTVDAADKGGFAGAGRPDNDDHLLRLDAQGAILKRLELAEPFADILADDDLFGCVVLGHRGHLVCRNRDLVIGIEGWERP